MKSCPSVTVVVPTFNSRDNLKDAVESLLAQDYPNFQVLVVDNNCTDGTSELIAGMQAAEPRLRYACELEQSVTCARNRGCMETDSDLVAFLDHDEVAPPAWLSTLVRGLEETGADGIGGPYLPLWEGHPPWWLRGSNCFHETLSFMDFGDQACPAEWLLGGNSLYTAEILRRACYFGDWKSYTSKRSLVGGDDIVMGQRMREVGARLWFEPAAGVYHKVPRSRQRLSYIVRRAFWAGYTDVAIGREWSLKGKGSKALARGADALVVGMAVVPGVLWGRLLVRLGYLRPLQHGSVAGAWSEIRADRPKPVPEQC